MSGNDTAGILRSEPPLDRRFEQIATLRNCRQDQSEADHCRQIRNSSISAYGSTCEYGAEGTPKRARPGFLRAEPRRQLRTTDQAPDEVAENVGRPHHREQVEDGPKSEIVVRAQCADGKNQCGCIEDAAG